MDKSQKNIIRFMEVTTAAMRHLSMVVPNHSHGHYLEQMESIMKDMVIPEEFLMESGEILPDIRNELGWTHSLAKGTWGDFELPSSMESWVALFEEIPATRKANWSLVPNNTLEYDMGWGIASYTLGSSSNWSYGLKDNGEKLPRSLVTKTRANLKLSQYLDRKLSELLGFNPDIVETNQKLAMQKSMVEIMNYGTEMYRHYLNQNYMPFCVMSRTRVVWSNQSTKGTIEFIPKLTISHGNYTLCVVGNDVEFLYVPQGSDNYKPLDLSNPKEFTLDVYEKFRGALGFTTASRSATVPSLHEVRSAAVMKRPKWGYVPMATTTMKLHGVEGMSIARKIAVFADGPLDPVVRTRISSILMKHQSVPVDGEVTKEMFSERLVFIKESLSDIQKECDVNFDVICPVQVEVEGAHKQTLHTFQTHPKSIGALEDILCTLMDTGLAANLYTAGEGETLTYVTAKPPHNNEVKSIAVEDNYRPSITNNVIIQISKDGFVNLNGLQEI